MRSILLFCLVCFCSSVFAQGEFMNNSTAIPAKSIGIKKETSTSSTVNSIYTPNVYNPAPAKSPSSGTIGENPVDFSKNTKFANPNDRYVTKLNQKETGENYKVFRKNQYLGDFKSNSKTVRIIYRDFGEVDGDEIKILVNDHIVASKIYLEGNYQTFQLDLIKGFNKIDFEALNQGLYGPNTAQFQVYDDKNELISSNQWNLATGFKATIIIFKE